MARQEATDSLFKQANEYLQSVRFEKSRKLFLEILSQEPRRPRALHGLALIASSTSRFEEATDYSTQAIRHPPINPALHTDLTACQNHLGRFKNAEENCHRALQIKPDYQVSRLYD
jgi:Tfp pilus assembly protein PilF